MPRNPRKPPDFLGAAAAAAGSAAACRAGAARAGFSSAGAATGARPRTTRWGAAGRASGSATATAAAGRRLPLVPKAKAFLGAGASSSSSCKQLQRRETRSTHARYMPAQAFCRLAAAVQDAAVEVQLCMATLSIHRWSRCPHSRRTSSTAAGSGLLILRVPKPPKAKAGFLAGAGASSSCTTHGGHTGVCRWEPRRGGLAGSCRVHAAATLAPQFLQYIRHLPGRFWHTCNPSTHLLLLLDGGGLGLADLAGAADGEEPALFGGRRRRDCLLLLLNRGGLGNLAGAADGEETTLLGRWRRRLLLLQPQ